MQADELDIAEPNLPRKLQDTMKQRLVQELPSSPEDHYKAIYYETLDTVIGCISDRFKQEGYQMYSKLEQFLIMEEQNEEDIDEVLKFYGSDFK